jgi:hypothetical protein
VAVTAAAGAEVAAVVAVAEIDVRFPGPL